MRINQRVRRNVLVLVALAAGLAACATDGRGPSVERSNKELVRAAFDRWRAGAGGPFELLAPDATWTIVGSSPASKTYSRQAFLDDVIAPFNARLSSPLAPTVRGLYADGDTVVIHFDGQAVARDGIPYRNAYTWYFRFEDAQVAEATAFFDTRVFDEFWNRVRPE